MNKNENVRVKNETLKTPSGEKTHKSSYSENRKKKKKKISSNGWNARCDSAPAVSTFNHVGDQKATKDRSMSALWKSKASNRPLLRPVAARAACESDTSVPIKTTSLFFHVGAPSPAKCLQPYLLYDSLEQPRCFSWTPAMTSSDKAIDPTSTTPATCCLVILQPRFSCATCAGAGQPSALKRPHTLTVFRDFFLKIACSPVTMHLVKLRY